MKHEILNANNAESPEKNNVVISLHCLLHRKEPKFDNEKEIVST